MHEYRKNTGKNSLLLFVLDVELHLYDITKSTLDHVAMLDGASPGGSARQYQVVLLQRHVLGREGDQLRDLEESGERFLILNL